MKIWKNVKRVFVLYFAFFSFFFLYQNTAFAAVSDMGKAITPGNMKEWDDGAKVERRSSGKGKDYQMSVTADTTGLGEGYYSFYLYDFTTRSVKNNDGIRFDISNASESELKINVTFTVSSKTNVTMAESSFAILESADESKKEVVYVNYGTISIPANFDGTVYVPFSQMSSEDGKKVALTQIQSWGITTTMSQEEQVQFTLGNIAFLTDSIGSLMDSYYLFYIKGDNEITVPTIGTAMKSYQVDVKDLEGNSLEDDISFFLEDDMAGVSISQDGKLEVGSDCVASEIIIYVKTNQSINYGKLKINMKQVNAEIVATGITKATDVKGITTSVYAKLNDYIKIIQILFFLIILFLIFILYEWFQEAKKNYNLIKSRLLKTFNEQEEEEEE